MHATGRSFHVLTHQEARELLAVYALDAVDDDEGALLEHHLAACPACRGELDAHREVAAALGNSVEPLPEGLWSNISSHVLPRAADQPPPMPLLVRLEPDADLVGELSVIGSGTFRGKGRLVALLSAAVAAAAAALVLGIYLVNADNQVAHLQGAIGETSRTAVVAALETPGHRVVNLDDASHHRLAQLVLLPSGQGYLESSGLAALPSKETYQLWGVIDGQTISLGILGTNPHLAAFSLAHSPRASTLGVSVEPAGGSVLPTEAMLASGTV
jgi:hypothetical protein